MRPAFAFALAWLAAAGALAQDPDAAALSLSGSSAPQIADAQRDWQLFVEGAAGRSGLRSPMPGGRAISTQRMSLDLQVDARIAEGLRGVFADRLDIDWQHGFEQRRTVNTLKDAYISWQPSPGFIVDVGRINQYSGVAIGYNPTDFFREGALRSVVSIDPASVKKNRQGSVMLRAQTLWDDGSLTALYSPAVGGNAAPGSGAFNADSGATNRRNRALLVLSKRLGADLNPQWLLYLDEGASPQLGVNATKLLNEATVAYLEWSGGSRRSLLAQATRGAERAMHRNQLSTGLTYTTRNKLSLTAEYEYNGAGLKAGEWSALPAASPPAYVAYRQFAQFAQELPTRRAVMLHAHWQDVFVGGLDLSAMVRHNLDDHSRLSWAELRYRRTRDEVAVQLQNSSGGPSSEFGAWPQRWGWQLLYRRFF